MASKSSFLPRLSLSRNDKPVLPFHNSSRSPPRRKSSEYDLSNLSPRPDDGLLASDTSSQGYRRRSPSYRSSSPSARYSDNASSAGSESKVTKSRLLFAGPPPPIATSSLLYHDEEESRSLYSDLQRPYNGSAASLARNAIASVSSVFFERGDPTGPPSYTNDHADRQAYEPDTFWRNLHQRQRALEKELQRILDAQSAGLAGNLGLTARAEPDGSDAGSATPTNGSTSHKSASSRERRRVVFDDAHGAEYGQVVIPVRQPRRKPMGLAAARKALARNMSSLADLKAEEDAALTSALATRKSALTRLKKLAGRRGGIVEALEASESGNSGQELKELEEERNDVAGEIAQLEEKLRMLRRRKRSLDERIEDVNNRREADLSSYRNALKEVDTNVSRLLQRPPVKPLDLKAIRPAKQEGEDGEATDSTGQSPGGVEFLRLRPERRTVDMARDWWESEVRILEERKEDVDRDLSALEQGIEVWNQVISLVSEYETSLLKEMNGEGEGDGKGKGRERTPEEAFQAQLRKMEGVMTELEELLSKAEENNWNLLICAIGAELQAFREAQALLRDALGAQGFGDPEHTAGEHLTQVNDDDGSTPRLGRSASGKLSPFKRVDSPRKEKLVDVRDGHDDTANPESDNEVPPDLLFSNEEADDSTSPVHKHSLYGGREDEEDSENEVPKEFLAEHDTRDKET